MLLINIFIIFAISFALTYLLIRYKDVIGFNAHINHRSMHKEVVPNSGGIAIFISFLVGLYLFSIDVGYGVVISMSLVFILGIFDDFYGTTAKVKLIMLVIVANILFFNGYHIQYLGTYLGYTIEMSSFVAYIFLVFVIVGFVNAMNMIDGLDGLVSLVGIIILSSFLYIGLKYSDNLLIYTPLIYIFSILGYLYFNWSPAKIFMGDNGSLPLGLIIAIISIHAVNMEYITPISILMLAALPILDTFVVVAKRIAVGKSPLTADKSHIHHIILKQQKNNTKRTVFILSLIQFLFSYIALGFKIKDDILILLLFVILYVLFYFLMTTKKN